ncbi:MAG TPA: hypothetical protein VH592_16800 [Gemmataceae bacterium]|jgi:hypothetical protein
MPRKDIKQVTRIAREEGIPPELRRDFGDYLESCKDHSDFGSGPRGDFTEKELCEKAREYKEMKGL